MKQHVLLLLCLFGCNQIFAQFILSGNIKTETDVPVEAVNVPVSQSATTDIFGDYAIENLSAGNYTVSPEKNTDPLNGVTICDLVGISKHILGLEILDSPYKILAADANLSGTVTTLDLVKVNRLLLGIDEDFNPNKSWRFVATDYVFNNPTNPWSGGTGLFNEVQISENTTLDFIGLKVGDVDNSALGSYPSIEVPNTDVLFFQHNNAVVDPQSNYVVEFRAEDFDDVLGFQFTLSYDSNQLEFVEMNSNALTNFNTTHYWKINDGAINMAWIDSSIASLSIPDGEMVFTATFNVLEQTNLETSLRFTGDHVAIASMDINGCYGELENVVLPTNTSENFILNNIDIYPNPTNTTFTVDVQLEKIVEVELALTNIIGQPLFSKIFSSKSILEQIDISHLPIGIYLLTINTEGQTITKRIIRS